MAHGAASTALRQTLVSTSVSGRIIYCPDCPSRTQESGQRNWGTSSFFRFEMVWSKQLVSHNKTA